MRSAYSLPVHIVKDGSRINDDFSCTLIVAAIENTGETIRWNKLGLNATRSLKPEEAGSSVKWFDELGPFEFQRADYRKMLGEFKKQIEIDQQQWEPRTGTSAKRHPGTVAGY